ncbi:MAG: antitoxin [Actinobacteria bacterium]|uniref:Unannotated protein n=1 Tax=freshwater metagenome TaxID=449393 RepID=A0A6J7L7K8_9ZZZZ|nr:antitoxin [Actinomycetota bacterium]
MRTTLDIDDHVLEQARVLSQELHVSLGAAVSLLARRGLAPRMSAGPLPTFEVSAEIAPLTPSMVRQALDE